MSSGAYYENIIIQCLLGQAANCTAPSIRNVRDFGVLNSGFLTGNTAPFASTVEVSFDDGFFQGALVTENTWFFPLPKGADSWKQNSIHKVTIRSGPLSAQRTVVIRKGNNQDVNGDGFPDVLVGANQFSAGTGKAYLFYGGVEGIVSQSANSAKTSIAGVPAGQYGWAVALGDVNGDGYADAVVGAPNAGADKVLIYHSLGGDGILTNATPSATLSAGSTMFFGGALAMGDINGDGFEDVVVGSYGYSTSTGRVDVFYSSGASGVPTGGLSNAKSTFIGSVINGRFGITVATGDSNGDGYSDILVGADGISRSYLFHSGGSGGISGQDLSTGGTANTILIGETGSQFGISVSLGDVTGDGFQDALIGARSYTANQGRAYVFHSNGGSGIPNQNLSGSGFANTILTGQGAGSFFGISVSLGDVNGDGSADALVGAYGLATGNSFLFLSGGSSGISSQNLQSGGTAHTTFVGETIGDQFGIFVNLVDANGDGCSDAAIGAYGYSGGGNTGRAYIFSGSSSGIPSVGAPNANTILTGEPASQFGYSIASNWKTKNQNFLEKNPYPRKMILFRREDREHLQCRFPNS
ncbi:VCBS repeat-containing protein [Leptospira sp. 201903070]|uniref:VCBS repeat-containing protein n=1 Tax=Leptospira ainlahdjerensis TaxID=2810033 RepID=A0ABS2UAR3_9LEPT|nr:FG-GAP-like repeat-containing protein [Leptospira ainlahdjerensis]MBM9577455.1 VCBS repeat-containing protein [Leptospira ainlahdjerensis]